MIDLGATDKAVLTAYPKHVVHMRRQFGDEKLCLVFGTGLTQPLGIPGWDRLNQELASDARVDGRHLLGAVSEEDMKKLLKDDSYENACRQLRCGPEETIITQRLYEHFRAKCRSAVPHDSLERNSDVQRDWRAIIREKLYSGQKQGPADEIATDLLKTHPYVKMLMPIVRRMPLTVTYNFDDVLELVLSGDRTQEERERGRGYETTIDIRKPPRNPRGVIYHPNGYIPRNTMEGGYDGIVLSEDEFADRMIETTSDQYAPLIHHLLRSTCLFIGLSLKDGVLKNMLKQAARLIPGHYHYYVHYYDEGKRPGDEEQRAIRAANFTTYNLITLFLSNDGIASLGRLITMGYDARKDKLDDADFERGAAEIDVRTAFYYYIVGAVGAGKSTVVSHLRDLITHDEWVEDRLPELAENWTTLHADEQAKQKRQRVDAWLAKQFWQKNHMLLEETVGIVVSDRCPLDPLAFTPPHEWADKAKLLLNTICPGKKKQVQLCPGQIIYLENDPRALDLRVRRTNKKYREPALATMQKDLEHIYQMNGFTKVNTRLMSLVEVMQRVATIIHLEPYAPADVHSRLTAVQDGTFAARCAPIGVQL